jgi:hypothetical protein
MVLLDSERVVITRRQIGLQVALDVGGRADFVQAVEHAGGIVSPVRRPGNIFEVVRAADLVEINK